MSNKIPYLKKNGQVIQLMVDDKPLIMLAGELHNSSAANLGDVKEKFDRLVELNLNTVITPLSWELIEPLEGKYDFKLLDGIISAAKDRGLYIVFLWFGAWKNGRSSYVPTWVKTDVKRFPRVQIHKGQHTDILTPFAGDLLAVETKAFKTVMQRIKKIDKDYNVVVLMQVENEVGVLGGPRDFSEPAEKLFSDPVPTALVEYLKEHWEELLKEVRTAWESGNRAARGTWSDLFEKDADEIFMAWHLASHIEKLASVGREEYDLPMYANAWLVQEGMTHPGQYPSGGPVSRMLDIWRAAAPHIDFLSPDIYDPAFKEVCASYTRGSNPLFIPEANKDARSASTAFYALGTHAAMGFAPFAIDDLQPGNPLGETYAVLKEMIPMLTEYQAKGRIIGFYQQDEHDRMKVHLGNYTAHIQSRKPLSETEVPGGGILLMVAPDEYMAIGRNYNISFSTPDALDTNVELLTVDEGTIKNNKWVHHRRLNGDETMHGQAIPLWSHLTVCRARLNTKVVPIYRNS